MFNSYFLIVDSFIFLLVSDTILILLPAGKWVEVCKDTRGRMLIFWEGKELAYELIKERGDISKEDLEEKRVEEEVREGVKQERWKPAEDHPWRRSFRLKKKTKDVTFQTGNYR